MATPGESRQVGVSRAGLRANLAPGSGPHLATLEHMSEAAPKILVVFFSRTGTTRRLAEAIARAEQGELEELRESRSRRGPIGWLRCGYEGTYARSAETLPLHHDLSGYDLVFVGSPTWNRALSSPVRGFLNRHRAELKDVALFATCAGHGAETVLAQMAALLNEAPLARLPLLERDAKLNPAIWAAEFGEEAVASWKKRHAGVGDSR